MSQHGETADISLVVNGESWTHTVEVRRTLADVLRDDLRLTGTHLGCEHGVCGACTVELDGAAVRSCLMLAVQADGATITTIEGLTNVDGSLSTLQAGFRDAHGFQCAFCAPGFLITAKLLLDENPAPSRAEIREAISGNLCRCTGYESIIASIEQVVRSASQADTTEVNS
ncbi:MAG: (2Fe-2S)-binding protein [Actinobacteria bacterium]|nr:(2Fe-2S)-binding protein [Actinomycetota bacterium]MBV9936115.1 (2Fe-2S)-binding protein [Actinomycetota bacterium]